MNYISGGYYIVSPIKRDDYMDKTILPETILSASECLCDFYPEVNILWGGSAKNKKSYAKELKLSKEKFVQMEKWVEENFEQKKNQFPQLFTTVNLAKEFSKMFLSHMNDIRIIGIGLPENLVEEFLEEEETLTKPDNERYGIETLLLNKTKLETEVTLIKGYEVLGFEFGKFHSYICNSLEKDYKKECSFSLNENGFISTLDMALDCCIYSNDEELGTEPVLWLPWVICEYEL
ncbi:hypothetical protein [Metabacillus litoralis]|uniref:hypothetical protein n=1 Tax=Metabacillus litoralis TaxID=152268 RepID=UPI001CFE88E1|nr:hypothetical protein [Metabacillus litoralis]